MWTLALLIRDMNAPEACVKVVKGCLRLRLSGVALPSILIAFFLLRISFFFILFSFFCSLFVCVCVWAYVWRVSLLNHKTVSQSFSESCSEAVLSRVAVSVSVAHSLLHTLSHWAWAASPGLWYITQRTGISNCQTHMQHFSIIHSYSNQHQG